MSAILKTILEYKLVVFGTSITIGQYILQKIIEANLFVCLCKYVSERDKELNFFFFLLVPAVCFCFLGLFVSADFRKLCTSSCNKKSISKIAKKVSKKVEDKVAKEFTNGAAVEATKKVVENAATAVSSKIMTIV